MLKLFEQRPTPSLGSIQASQIHQLRVRAKSVHQTLTDYFQTSAFRLPNTHLLIQITKNLEYALDTPFDKVVETVYARAPYVARHFNLTSQISYGKYHKHVFYSSQYNDCVDYIFSNNIVDVDPFDKERKWKDLSPVEVIHHPCTDFKLLPINGELRVPLSGYSVVHIDIPLLALQYRAWCEDMIKTFQHDAVYNVNKFIVTKVLPKLYPSHMDYTLVNLMGVKEGTVPKTENSQWLPIALPDMQKPAEDAVNELHKKLTNSRRPYLQTLESYPSLFQANGLEALKMPIVIPTRQLNWLQVISRLPVIETMISLQGKSGREVNKSYLSEFKRDAGFFLNAREYEYVYPQSSQNKLVESLERIMKM